MAAALPQAITQGKMDGCSEERSVNWLDRETQKRLCRQSQQLLQRAQARAVNPSSLEKDLREEGKSISLNTSFKTMAEYMDYVSSQCGRFHNLAPEKEALNHVCRYHRNQLDPMSSSWVTQARTHSKDIRIELSPGTYAVTVGSPHVTTTRMIEVDSGQTIDLTFPL